MTEATTAPAPFAFEPWELSQILPADQRAAYRERLGQRVEEYHQKNNIPWPQDRATQEKEDAAIMEAIKDPEKRRQVAVILINTGYLSPDYLTL